MVERTAATYTEKCPTCGLEYEVHFPGPSLNGETTKLLFNERDWRDKCVDKAEGARFAKCFSLYSTIRNAVRKHASKKA